MYKLAAVSIASVVSIFVAPLLALAQATNSIGTTVPQNLSTGTPPTQAWGTNMLPPPLPPAPTIGGAAFMGMSSVTYDEVEKGATTTFANTAPWNLFPTELKRGDHGIFVKDLQTTLRSDPSIYPERLVTGYFGPLTETAVKRVQSKFGLYPTGVVDATTQALLAPVTSHLKLFVLAPNTGDTWHAGDVVRLSFLATTTPDKTTQTSGDKAFGIPDYVKDNPLRQTFAFAWPDQSILVSPNYVDMAPIFRMVSVDLVRDTDAAFRYHVTTLPITGPIDSPWTWQVPNDIPAGSDYHVQMTVGPVVPCMRRIDETSGPEVSGVAKAQACLAGAHPGFYVQSSSGPIAIGGYVSSDKIAKLSAQIDALEAVLKQLLDTVQQMKAGLK